MPADAFNDINFGFDPESEEARVSTIFAVFEK
jgi:hypothetical protein